MLVQQVLEELFRSDEEYRSRESYDHLLSAIQSAIRPMHSSSV